MSSLFHEVFGADRPSLPVRQPGLVNAAVKLVAAIVRTFLFVTLVGVFLVYIGKINCNQIEHVGSLLYFSLPLIFFSSMKPAFGL
jgi:hypothetical protein